MTIILLILQVLIFCFLHPNVENLKTDIENKVMNLIENAGKSFALQSLQKNVSEKSSFCLLISSKSKPVRL